MFKKVSFWLILIVIISTFGFAHITSASSTDNLSGWAWSSNIGWISFNCVDTVSCGQSNFGVTADPVTGNLSGYAWSSNIGWINFGDNGCPSGVSGPCAPKMDITSKTITGWAKALSADGNGWDGWISLSGSVIGGGTYGVKIDGSQSFAWGSEVVGWVDFSGVLYGATPTTCTYNISPGSGTFTSEGGSGNFRVNVLTGTNCVWTAVPNVSWVTISPGSSGAGSGTVYYDVGVNTLTSTRQGIIAAAGQTFVVNQGKAALPVTVSCNITTPAPDLSKPNTYYINNPLTFTAAGSDGTPPYTFTWWVNESQTSPPTEGDHATLLFQTIGQKHVKVQITDSAGSTSYCNITPDPLILTVDPDYQQF